MTGNIVEEKAKTKFLKEWIGDQIIQRQGKEDVALCLMLQEIGGSDMDTFMAKYDIFKIGENLHGNELQAVINIMAQCKDIEFAEFDTLPLNDELFHIFLSSVLEKCKNLKITIFDMDGYQMSEEELLDFCNCLNQIKAEISSFYVTGDPTLRPGYFNNAVKILAATNTAELVLWKCQLPVDMMQKFAIRLSDLNVKLTTLWLNERSTVDSGTFNHLAKILKSTRADNLALERCELSHDDVKSFSEALIKLDVKLGSLLLAIGKTLECEAFSHFAKIVQSTRPDSLELYESKLSQANMQPLSEALAERDIKLTTLSLEGNRTVDPGTFNHLAKILKSTKAKQLALKRCKLSHDDLRNFSEALIEQDVKLEGLSLAIDENLCQDFSHFAKIVQSTRPDWLCLLESELSQENMQPLSEALAECDIKLGLLLLDGNHTVHPGTSNHLAKILKSTKADGIFLKRCELSHDELKSFSEALIEHDVKVIRYLG